MVRRSASGWTVALGSAAFFGVIFVAFGGISSGYSLDSVFWLSVSGVLLGLVAAPDLEPKAFRLPTLWQIIFCVLGLEVLAFYLRLEPGWHAAAVAAGCLLGCTAKFWTKHINPP